MDFNKWFTEIKKIIGEKITDEERIEKIMQLPEKENYILFNDWNDKFIDAYNYTIETEAGDIYWDAEHNSNFDSEVDLQNYCEFEIIALQKKMEDMYSELRANFFDEMARKLIVLMGKKEFRKINSITIQQFYDIMDRIEWVDLSDEGA